MRIVIIISLLLISWLILELAFANPEPIINIISDEDAVKAIIGEAENQGYQGMLAVACAIRNRGHLDGVYGLKSHRVINHQYSHNVEHNALLAWYASKNKDITGGASVWGTKEDIKKFMTESWFVGYFESSFQYKDHVFFRRVQS